MTIRVDTVSYPPVRSVITPVGLRDALRFL